MSKFEMNRRGLLKASAAAGVTLATPTIFTSSAWSAAYTNEPTGSTVTLGFNVPQTGAYADEGADELRAYQLAVEHINGEGDGGMLNTFSSKASEGQRRERQERSSSSQATRRPNLTLHVQAPSA